MSEIVKIKYKDSVNAYDIIKLLENNIDFVKLLQKGIVPLSVLDKKVYYEYYLSKRKTDGKMQSIFLAAEEFNVSEMTIRRAIDFMRA